MSFQIKKLPFEEFKYVYDRVPRLCVDLLVSDGTGVLLSRRDISPGEGLWHMPGGTVLKGESIQHALERIADEEAGIKIFWPEMVGVMEFKDPQNPFFHTVSLVHEVNHFEGELRGSHQGREIRFHQTLPVNIIVEQREFILKR